MATDTKQIKTLGEDSLNYDKLKKKKGAQSIFVPLLSGGISPAPSSCLCAKTLRLTGCCGWFCQTFGGVFASFCSMF